MTGPLCQLCSHAVVVVGFVCFDDPWGYAVGPLMPDRSKVRFQTKRFRDASAHQTCLCMRTSDGVTAFKKG